MANNAKLPDLKTLQQAGIDPKTRLPLKMGQSPELLKENEKKLLRVLDEQEAINRYVWYNLPSGLTSQQVERMLYYKYSLMFFFKDTDQGGEFFCLPYALDGDIDVYGRFNQVTPCIFGGPGKADKDDVWIEGLTFNVVKDVAISFDEVVDNYEKGCVLIRDYTQQFGELGISRQILQDSLIDALAEAVPLARTNMFANSGVTAMRISDETCVPNVMAANQSIEHAALSGQYLIPIASPVDFQEITNGGSATASQDFMVYLEALNNHRLSFLGIDSTGTYQKSTYVNQSQTANANTAISLVLNDGLLQRQHACDLINSIWGLGVWCELNEALVGDINMDGIPMEQIGQEGEPNDTPEDLSGGEIDE